MVCTTEQLEAVAQRAYELLTEWAASGTYTWTRDWPRPVACRDLSMCHDWCDANQAELDAFEEAHLDWHEGYIHVNNRLDELIRRNPIPMTWRDE